MAKVRTVKITVIATFEINEDSLKEAYEANTFEQALENQRKWIEDGEFSIIELIADSPVDEYTLEFVD